VNALEAMARAEVVRCAALVKLQVDRAGRALAYVDPADVQITATLRGRTYRGMAYLHTRRINLNPGYFEAVGEAYRQTVAHEYAHLCVYAWETAGRARAERSHGPRWQSLMRLFGYATTRTSAYGCVVPKARRTRKYFYRCVNDSAHVFRATSGQHKRLQAGSPGYCPKCLPLRPRHECGIAFDREEFA
jgi:predicted SprT family Zn-dependent metalloprotease